MPDSSRRFIGSSFLTTRDVSSGPVRRPLEQLAIAVRRRPELPQFHPDEFMYMATVHGGCRRVTIHLYKHIDTRRYLNLDDAGHAYAYQFRVSDPHSLESGGRYRCYRSVADALESVGLWAFADHGLLFRSFPPEEWDDRRLG